MSKKKISYKESIEELQSILSRIEADEPDIDELSSLVKRALELVRLCREKLRETDEDIQKSLKEQE